MEVVDVDRILRHADRRTRRSRRGRCPRFTPAPASQEENAQWWCSRPLASALLLKGVRPNSVVQTTSVSSSRPRLLQVLEAGRRSGRSTFFASGACVDHVAVGVPVVRRSRIDQFDEAHAALDQPPGHQALPGEARRAAALQGRRAPASRRVSVERSNASGASACMPKAVSNDSDPGGQGRVAVVAARGAAVQLGQGVQLALLQASGRRAAGRCASARGRARRACPGGCRAGSRTPRPGRRRKGSAGRSPRTRAGCGWACPARS